MTDNTSPEMVTESIEQLQAKLAVADFDLYAFMDMAANEVLKLTPATGAVVELVEGDEMVYRAATGAMKPFLGLRLPKQGSLTGLAVETKEILTCEDTENDPRVNLNACRTVHARSMVVVPLFQTRRPVGVLKIISDQPNSFTQHDIDILKRISDCLGSALGQQIYQEVRKFF